MITWTVYIIELRTNPGNFWSNDLGWVGLQEADLFVNTDYSLPIDGMWCQLTAEYQLWYEEE